MLPNQVGKVSIEIGVGGRYLPRYLKMYICSIE